MEKNTCSNCYYCSPGKKHFGLPYSTCRLNPDTFRKISVKYLCKHWLSRKSSERSSEQNYTIALENHNKLLADVTKFKLIISEADLGSNSKSRSRIDRVDQARQKLSYYHTYLLPTSEKSLQSFKTELNSS